MIFQLVRRWLPSRRPFRVRAGAVPLAVCALETPSDVWRRQRPSAGSARTGHAATSANPANLWCRTLPGDATRCRRRWADGQRRDSASPACRAGRRIAGQPQAPCRALRYRPADPAGPARPSGGPDGAEACPSRARRVVLMLLIWRIFGAARCRVMPQDAGAAWPRVGGRGAASPACRARRNVEDDRRPPHRTSWCRDVDLADPARSLDGPEPAGPCASRAQRVLLILLISGVTRSREVPQEAARVRRMARESARSGAIPRDAVPAPAPFLGLAQDDDGRDAVRSRWLTP
jgi:hypothetical protein